MSLSPHIGSLKHLAVVFDFDSVLIVPSNIEEENDLICVYFFFTDGQTNEGVPRGPCEPKICYD